MSLPPELIEEAIQRARQLEEQLRETPPPPPPPPTPTPPPQSSQPQQQQSRPIVVSSGRAVDVLKRLCEAVGGKLLVPSGSPDKPLCIINHVYGIYVDYDRSRNVDRVEIDKFVRVEYRQAGRYRRREIVTEKGSVEIAPARSVKFEVEFYDTTRKATMPSLDITIGNYYDIVQISRRTRKLTEHRTVSMACTASDTSREHKVTCVLFAHPEVPYRFEFDMKTKRWKMLKGKRAIDVFRGI